MTAVSALLNPDKGVGVMEVMQQELISKVGSALNFQFIDSLNRFRSHCALVIVYKHDACRVSERSAELRR